MRSQNRAWNTFVVRYGRNASYLLIGIAFIALVLDVVFGVLRGTATRWTIVCSVAIILSSLITMSRNRARS